MPEAWTIEGDYVEACNCNVACQCIWLVEPDDNVCTVSLAWRIREGHYGDVDLSGLSVSYLFSTEEGVMFAPETGWDAVLLIDERADADQRSALEDIYLGRAGGIWAAVADVHLESTEVATAPFEYSRDGTDVTVEVGDVVSMDAEGVAGITEEVGTITPHPLTTSNEMQTARSTTAVVSYDDQFTWDVSGNNSYLGDFELTNA